MLHQLTQYYSAQGILASEFDCKYFKDCSNGCSTFSTAEEAFVGEEYEKGTLPRLLFVSLDGGYEKSPDVRDVVGRRREVMDPRLWSRLKGKPNHWNWTNRIPLELLKDFHKERIGADLDIDDVRLFFAHTPTVKCCENNPHGGADSSESNVYQLPPLHPRRGRDPAAGRSCHPRQTGSYGPGGVQGPS